MYSLSSIYCTSGVISVLLMQQWLTAHISEKLTACSLLLDSV